MGFVPEQTIHVVNTVAKSPGWWVPIVVAVLGLIGVLLKLIGNIIFRKRK